MDHQEKPRQPPESFEVLPVKLPNKSSELLKQNTLVYTKKNRQYSPQPNKVQVILKTILPKQAKDP